MTESDRDPRLLEAYRSLGGEAPPAALDAAILAAARRRGTRWIAPVAAAATLVFAVGVALVVQREEPRTREEVALAPQVIPAPAPAERQAAPAEPGRLAEQAPASKLAGMAAKPTEDGAAPAAGALRKSEAETRAESPEQWLKRIAELRDAGRHKEADESLAKFRKRYPDYRIPEELRARVLTR